MEMKTKDIERVHNMAVKALKQLQAVDRYLETYIDDPIALQVFPRVAFATNNVFLVQDALGGEIEYTDWFGKKYCTGTLTKDGIEYMQFGLTEERIRDRKGALEL